MGGGEERRRGEVWEWRGEVEGRGGGRGGEERQRRWERYNYIEKSDIMSGSVLTWLHTADGKCRKWYVCQILGDGLEHLHLSIIKVDGHGAVLDGDAVGGEEYVAKSFPFFVRVIIQLVLNVIFPIRHGNKNRPACPDEEIVLQRALRVRKIPHLPLLSELHDGLQVFVEAPLLVVFGCPERFAVVGIVPASVPLFGAIIDNGDALTHDDPGQGRLIVNVLRIE
mmetsp:Transcript_2144/g.5942  ORF Transcript_2144/g.5942 Transcript_2144/m.5942 type:complete len:224 (-) Transcript_2144:1099-1770(-)